MSEAERAALRAMREADDKQRRKMDADLSAAIKRHLSGELVEYKGILAAMTTNDEQGKYGEQPKREPLMKDDEISRPLRNHPDTIAEIRTAREVRDWYETEITEGRLMVVGYSRTKMVRVGMFDIPCCDQCDRPRTRQPMYPEKNCPGCGSKIVEA